MISVYIIQLPRGYHPRVMAFNTIELAIEICEALNKDRYNSASGSGLLEVIELHVYERGDVKVLEYGYH